MADFERLRAEYPRFLYAAYDTAAEADGALRLTYTFIQKKGDADFVTFRPSWTMPFSYAAYAESPLKPLMEKTIFYLGCTELISYWKCCCSPQVEIRCGALSRTAAAWFKKLYFNGLGEFFYRNGIETDASAFMALTAREDTARLTFPADAPEPEGFLIPVGGGKDSVVTMELLRPYRAQSQCFIVNLDGAPVQTARAAGFANADILRPVRRLDPQILELNRQGFLNGHTPFSAILAFSAYLCALAAGKKYIVLSNESSANDAYVRGTSVNHQYSKSLEFENDFRHLVREELGGGAEYFSLLRPLNEWRIARLFMRTPQYLPLFKSCNLGSKKNVWCGKCAKCLFVYILLSPFATQAQLNDVFGGRDLLDDAELEADFEGLVSERFDKPFECVGTRAEINTALTRTLQKYQNERRPLPRLLRLYQARYYDPAFDADAADAFFDQNNNVPDFLKEAIKWD